MPYAFNFCLPGRVNIILVFMCLYIYLHIFFHSHICGYTFQILNRASIINVIHCRKNGINWYFFQMQTSYPLMNRSWLGRIKQKLSSVNKAALVCMVQEEETQGCYQTWHGMERYARRCCLVSTVWLLFSKANCIILKNVYRAKTG